VELERDAAATAVAALITHGAPARLSR